jgi:hypothetical protein
LLIIFQITNYINIFLQTTKIWVRLGLRFRKKKSAILNQIVENEPFENCVFKKLRFENTEKCLFKSHAMWCFFENAVF